MGAESFRQHSIGHAGVFTHAPPSSVVKISDTLAVDLDAVKCVNGILILFHDGTWTEISQDDRKQLIDYIGQTHEGA